VGVGIVDGSSGVNNWGRILVHGNENGKRCCRSLKSPASIPAPSLERKRKKYYRSAEKNINRREEFSG
jgi:hypothetical protein